MSITSKVCKSVKRKKRGQSSRFNKQWCNEQRTRKYNLQKKHGAYFDYVREYEKLREKNG